MSPRRSISTKPSWPAWPLWWGTTLMAVTGVMLWAAITVGNLRPRWWLDVATAIHFYEAVLATLAIIVWHFYQVFFDPDAYPMNWAWWDGQLSLEHYQAEHPLDLEAVLEAGHGQARDRRRKSRCRMKQKTPTPGPRTLRRSMGLEDKCTHRRR